MQLRIFESEHMEPVENEITDLDLEYDDLEYTVWDDAGGDHDIEISWVYTADSDFVTEALIKYLDETDIKNINMLTEDEKETFVSSHYKALCEKYYEKLLEYFREKAESDAYQNNDYNYSDYKEDSEAAYGDYLYDFYNDR